MKTFGWVITKAHSYILVSLNPHNQSVKKALISHLRHDKVTQDHSATGIQDPCLSQI